MREFHAMFPPALDQFEGLFPRYTLSDLPFIRFSRPVSHSNDQVFEDVSGDVREADVEALELDAEPEMIDSEQMEEGRVQVVHMNEARVQQACQCHQAESGAAQEGTAIHGGCGCDPLHAMSIK